ncbi:MAG: nucleoside deaminase [Gammaproteobacteria bacterium]|nr:nucleoside deaminase [Gammaproteobacteria bacterium]
MFSQPLSISFQLPVWVNNFSQSYQATTDLNQRMKFVISAARKNVEEETGGPFAAAIFEIETGKLVSLGINLVTTQQLSILHAEMVAITVAQAKLKTYDLAETSLPKLELVTSTEPCAMCFGAIPWSGVARVVTAAKGEDAQNIGFDEGPKPDNWIKGLTDRGIQVIDNIERETSQAVLKLYQESSGHIYNSREN